MNRFPAGDRPLDFRHSDGRSKLPALILRACVVPAHRCLHCWSAPRDHNLCLQELQARHVCSRDGDLVDLRAPAALKTDLRASCRNTAAAQGRMAVRCDTNVAPLPVVICDIPRIPVPADPSPDRRQGSPQLRVAGRQGEGIGPSITMPVSGPNEYSTGVSVTVDQESCTSNLLRLDTAIPWAPARSTAKQVPCSRRSFPTGCSGISLPNHPSG